MAHWFSHLRTVAHHRRCVFRLCVKAGIPGRGLVHDLSKYSFREFLPGARFWTGDESPNIGERAEYGFSGAWMHHKGRNRHHFEYWTDYLPERGGLCGVEMPPQFFKEMVCDRIAASKIYRGTSYTEVDPLAYFESQKAHYLIHPKTASELERILTMLRDEGESKTLHYLRSYPNNQ